MRTLIAFVALFVLTGQASAVDTELERSLGMLDRLDAARVTLEYEDDSLLRVLDEMSMVLPYSIVADWDALESIGVEMRTSVTVNARDASALTVLRGVAAQVGDDYEWPTLEAFGGQIVLTTPDAAASMRLTGVYDVRDLIADDDVLDSLRPRATEPTPEPTPEPTREPVGQATGEGGEDEERALSESDFAPDDENAPPLTRGESLARLVMEHVDPEGWIAFGGLRGRVTDRDGVLMITATPMTHRRLRDAFSRLRRAHPSAIILTAALIDVPRSTFTKLSRRYDGASEALAGALLVAPDSTMIWESTSNVKLGSTVRTRSSSEARAVRVEVTPVIDERSVLSLAIEAETDENGARRTVETTAAIAGIQGGAVVELPGATHDDTARLLVLLPERG